MTRSIPSVSVNFLQHTARQSNELGMRPMQERVYAKRGEQYLLIKSPPRFRQKPCTDVCGFG